MVLYVMSNGTPEENLIQIFRIFDINTDGLLSPKEVEKVVKYLFKIFPQKEYPDEASQKVLAKNAFQARSIKRWVWVEELHSGRGAQRQDLRAYSVA